MAYTHDDVVTAIQAAFPNGDASSLLAILERYGMESCEREKERVQLAIIALSGGCEDRLDYFVQAAKTDYRDVLCWQESGPLSQEEGRVQQQAVRRLLDQWGS